MCHITTTSQKPCANCSSNTFFRKAKVIIAAKMLFSKLPDSNQDNGRVTAPSPDEEGNVYEEANIDQESNIAEIRKDKSSPVEKVLTLRQLLLRRGLALLVMVFILAVGIVASELLVRYLK